MTKITTDKNGYVRLKKRIIELRNDGNEPPFPRAILEAMIKTTLCYYQEGDELRRYPSTRGVLSGEATVVYVFDATTLRQRLRTRSIDLGRTSVPTGVVNFESAFDEAWSILKDTLNDTTAPALGR